MSSQQQRENALYERIVREEIVSRCLIEELTYFAGIFAECHFTVHPDVICLFWDETKLGPFRNPQFFFNYAARVMEAINMPYRISVVGEVRPRA